MKNNCIVLIGMPGVGKSSLGKVLAHKLKFNFVDVDEYITEREGKSSAEIIEAYGEEFYLELEKRRMYEIILENLVASPGGSIIYHPDLMAYLKKNSTLIYLKDSLENIEKRLKSRTKTMNCIIGIRTKTLKEIFEERVILYQKYCDIKICIEHKTIDEIVGEIQGSCG